MRRSHDTLTGRRESTANPLLFESLSGRMVRKLGGDVGVGDATLLRHTSGIFGVVLRARSIF